MYLFNIFACVSAREILAVFNDAMNPDLIRVKNTDLSLLSSGPEHTPQPGVANPSGEVWSLLFICWVPFPPLLLHLRSPRASLVSLPGSVDD